MYTALEVSETERLQLRCLIKYSLLIFPLPVILYELYSRKEPYEGENINEVLRAVADKHIRKRPPIPSNMPTDIKALMSDCLKDEPEMRPTFEEMDIRLRRFDADTLSPFQPKPKSLSLFDIFPQHVAKALQDGRKVEPEHKEMVTIFFSDIVGFTDLSSKLDPLKVANMLDRLYRKFDELSHTHDLYKVETIGKSRAD